MDCIFCKIRDGEIPSDIIYQDEKCFVIKDISPIAPTHLLLITKEHLDDCLALASNPALASHVFKVIGKISKSHGLDGGFRVVTNKGEKGGQSVPHLHFHLLGSNKILGWPKL